MPNFRAQFDGAPYGGPADSEIQMLETLAKLSQVPMLGEALYLAATEARAERRCAKQAQNALRMLWLKFVGNPAAKLPF